MAIQNAISDRNDKYSILVQQGSVGTAAVEGTSQTMRVGGDPVTGAMYVMDLAGAAGTTNVNVLSGTITEVSNLAKGTITRIEGGTIALNTGTVNGGDAASDSTFGYLNYGRMNVYNGATWDRLRGDTTGGAYVQVRGSNGTITRVGNVGTVEAIASGTIQNSGTTTGVGVVTSVTNLVSGTLLNSGTTTGVGVVTSVTNLVGGTVTALANGTITAGTVTRVGNVGTIESGTVKLNPNPSIASNVFGTTSAGTIGTIVAAPSAGSAILIDSLDVSQISGTAEVVVSYGIVAVGNGVVTRGLYPAGGGISKNPTYPIGGSITGSALTWNILSGSGTVSYSVAYRILVP